MPDNFHPELAGTGGKHIGNPLAVELAIIQHIHLLGAETLGPGSASRTLNVIGRMGPEIVCPSGTIDSRFCLARSQVSSARDRYLPG